MMVNVVIRVVHSGSSAPLVHPEERATVLQPRQAQGTAHAVPQQGAGRLSEVLCGLGARGAVQRWVVHQLRRVPWGNDLGVKP